MQPLERTSTPRPRRRRYLETGTRLDLNHLIRNGVTTGEFRARMGEDGAECVLSADLSEGRHNWLRLQLPGLDQTFGVEWQRRHFGGKQWYFLCPMSGHRACVLYRPRGMSSFACQRYWRRRYGYSSQFLTGLRPRSPQYRPYPGQAFADEPARRRRRLLLPP